MEGELLGTIPAVVSFRQPTSGEAGPEACEAQENQQLPIGTQAQPLGVEMKRQTGQMGYLGASEEENRKGTLGEASRPPPGGGNILSGSRGL